MSKSKKTLKRVFWGLIIIIAAGVILVAGCELAVYSASKGRVYSDVDAIAYNAANTIVLRWRVIMFLRERASRVKAVLFCGRQAL